MHCAEKIKLIEAYQVFVANYSTALTNLHLAMGKLSKDDYDLRLQKLNSEREASEKARHELNRHAREHRC